MPKSPVRPRTKPSRKNARPSAAPRRQGRAPKKGKPAPSTPTKRTTRTPPPEVPPGPDDFPTLEEAGEESLGRALRESLGLPPLEEDPSTPPEPLAEELAEEEANVVTEGAEALAPEPPPEVRVVSVGSFVPTGHLVCEGCGRIVRWAIPETTRKELAELAITSPEGWEVRSLAVSFTGFCPNCRRSTGRR